MMTKTTLWLRAAYVISLLAIITFALPACGGDDDDDDDFAYGDNDSEPGDDPAVDYAVRLADTWLRTYEPAQNAWSWDGGVLMMGMLALADQTGDARYADYVRAWLDHHMDAGYEITSSDTAIPAYLALLMYDRSGDERYLAPAHDAWDYIRQKAGRTRDGGLNHLGVISGNQIWIDSLFMIGPFLLRYGEITQSIEPQEELALQFEVFRRHLRAPGVGLYRHRYDDDTGEVAPQEPIFWGRGNGWVFVAMNIANGRLPDEARGGHRIFLAEDIDTMLASVLSFSEDAGRLHTILNRPDTYAETSAGLLFAYGVELGAQEGGAIARQRREDAERWIQGAIDQIVTDAAGDTLLLGTSFGTSPGDIANYEEVLKGENVAYGVGLYLLAVTEREKAGRFGTLREAAGASGESFADPPVPCAGVACVAFHIARGNFTAAKRVIADMDDAGEPSSDAIFADALIDIIRAAFDLYIEVDVGYTDGAGLDPAMAWLAGEGRERFLDAADKLALVEDDPAFAIDLFRLVILESGGSSAIGAREYDLGEAYLLEGVARAASAIALLAAPEDAEATGLFDRLSRWRERAVSPDIEQGFEELAAAIDKIIIGIEAIMAETDDQSDDFIPKNLLELRGSFGIPGLLPEQPVGDLLTDLLGPDVAMLLQTLNMPGDLVGLLRAIASAIRLFF